MKESELENQNTPTFIENTAEKSYHEQTYIDNTLRLREILKTLPSFAKDYFRAIEPTTSAKTRISYAYDIRVFFRFLMENNPLYKNYSVDQFETSDLERLEPVDIEEYLEFLKVYKNDEEKQITNTENGLSRKMSALRSFYSYYFKHQMISKNPTLFVDMPKLHEKAIVRLDTDEIALLLDFVEHGGDKLSGQKKAYYEKTKNRDLAIITLLLGTVNVKFPSISDIVPIEVLPFTTTEAPIIVSPVLSRTVPFTVTPFCANVGKQLNSNKSNK